MPLHLCVLCSTLPAGGINLLRKCTHITEAHTITVRLSGKVLSPSEAVGDFPQNDEVVGVADSEVGLIGEDLGS